MSPYFYYAFVIFIFPASGNAFPLHNGDSMDISNDKIARLTTPFFPWLPKKSPEDIRLTFRKMSPPRSYKITANNKFVPYEPIQDANIKETPKEPEHVQKSPEVTRPMFKIISPLHYFKKTADNKFVPYEPIQDANIKETPKGPKYEQRAKDIIQFQEQLRDLRTIKKIEKAVQELGSQFLNGLWDLLEEPLKTEKTETQTQLLNPTLPNTGGLTRADENTPHDPIYNLFMKMLGHGKMDRNLYVPNDDFDDLDQVPDTSNNIEEGKAQGAIKNVENVSPFKSIDDEKDTISEIVGYM